MAKFYHAPIAELAHQLKLSPLRLRWRQLDAAEYLIDLIQADGHYPYEFICHQMTGYRPKSDETTRTMPGRKLIEDLVVLVEELSGSAILPVEAIPSACWTTEELANRLNVSTKTICRWRRRGMPGRRLRFEDGTIRMAFLERSVRRFVVKHQGLVSRGAAFSQLTKDEKRRIIEMARAELAEHRMRPHELSQVIAAKMNRAVETVRYTLRRHDEAHPQQALFRKGRHPVVQPELQAVFDAVEAGESAERVGRRLGKSPATVHAIVREVRARRLRSQELAYVANEAFDAPDAESAIRDELRVTAESPTRKSKPPRDLPPYLQELYRYPLLTPERERCLFKAYNFFKCKADRMRKAIDPLATSDAELDAVDAVLAEVEVIRNDILRANLRLVVSIARRHAGRAPQFFEIVSDGNLALMRAVEKFDYARGFKFSTYASWAVMRSYARTVPEHLYASNRLVTGMDELLATAPASDEAPQDSVVESARSIIQQGLKLLSPREREVVVQHYGLDTNGKTKTLDQIGKAFGVTKERIRQIERKALHKLQTTLGAEPDGGVAV